MNQKAKELWVIPAIVALATGIPLGALFMFLGLWLAGTPFHVSLSLAWFISALTTQLPVWVTLCVLTVAAVAIGLFIRQRARTAEEKARCTVLSFSLEYAEAEKAKIQETHTAELARMKNPPPQMVVVWTPATCLWDEQMYNGKQGMYVRGNAHISMKGVRTDIVLVQAQVNGAPPTEFGPLLIRLGSVSDLVIFVDAEESLGTKHEPLTVELTFIDNRNRKYTVPPREFLWNDMVGGKLVKPDYGWPHRNYWE